MGSAVILQYNWIIIIIIIPLSPSHRKSFAMHANVFGHKTWWSDDSQSFFMFRIISTFDIPVRFINTKINEFIYKLALKSMENILFAYIFSLLF